MADDVKKVQGSGGLDHSIALEYAFEYEEDKKNYQIALLIAIIFHVLLIWAKIPEGSGPDINNGPKEEKKMRRVILTPPPEQKLEEIKMKKKAKKVPVPDPTPDEPEPIVPVETDVEDDIVDENMDEFLVGVPDAPPTPTGPVRNGIAGLEPPVYDIGQLQRNVIYPELGKKARMQGMVILEVVLRKDGTVGDIKVIGGLRALGFPDAAIRAVKRLKFTPGKLRGVPVDVIMVLTVHFQLKKGK